MICYYHRSDFDGHCSGAIVKLANPICELRGIDYGDEFPWDEVQGEDVIMVDFSLQPFDNMIRLRDESTDLTWIDHHVSAIEEAEKYMFWEKTDGVQDSDLAACELTWNYYFPHKPMPEIVRLLGRYDVWDHSDPKTLPFQSGMKLYTTFPNAYIDLWKKWFEEFPAEIIEEGKIVQRYIERDNARYASSCAFETELDGFKGVAINKSGANSQLFDSVWNEDKYDIMITFGFKVDKWTVSLYATKEDIDVSEIAKNHGGGGHKGAAGFVCDELPFSLVKK